MWPGLLIAARRQIILNARIDLRAQLWKIIDCLGAPGFASKLE